MSQLSLTEQDDLRAIVESLFDKQNTAHWEMNEALLGVITKLLKAENICSSAMDFVPRPGVYLNPDDVRKELARIAKRVVGIGASYEMCRVIAKRNWRTEAEVAATFP